MQANKTSPQTREQLEKWLKNPASGSSAISKSARDDIEFLQNSKDLSTVSLVPHHNQEPSSPPNEKSSVNKGSPGAFAALLACVGKRK